MNLKVEARSILAIAHGVFGLINLVVFVLSGSAMIHMGVLGLFSLIIGVGLFTRKPWFPWLAIAFAPLTITMGVTTLYASVGFFGFNPNQQVLLFNLGLTAYSITALFLLFYLIAKRRLLLR